MKLIAHRGLINRSNKELENTIDQILHAIELGFDCEIDVWFENNKWFLGHDCPKHEIDFNFLKEPGLWIHCKNFQACEQLSSTILNYFWHEEDQRTLTSHNYWWTYPGYDLGKRSIAVMPEWVMPLENIPNLKLDCYGVCSDFVGSIQN